MQGRSGMVLYERLDVFVKHVWREVFHERPPFQYRLQDFGKHDGYDAGSAWWVEAFDLLSQRMGQSCSIDLCPILKQELSRAFFKLVRTFILIRRRVNIIWGNTLRLDSLSMNLNQTPVKVINLTTVPLLCQPDTKSAK